MALETVSKIKWKNIFGLVFLILIIYLIFAIGPFIEKVTQGDCVEKDETRVCFKLQKGSVGLNETTTITASIQNKAKYEKGVKVAMYVSPNMAYVGNNSYEIPSLAPGDTLDRVFTVQAGAEKGRFFVGYDINNDEKIDYTLYVSVGR